MLPQVQLKHEAMMILEPPVGQFSQPERALDARDHRLDHPPAAHAEDIADDRVQLDVGFFERFLNPLDMAGLLAGQLLAGAQHDELKRSAISQATEQVKETGLTIGLIL